MTITVFGANGGIGRILVQIALDNNYKVNAYVRNKNKLKISHQNLTLIEGELNDYSKIKEVISNSDVVISTLGPSMKAGAKGSPVKDGHINIMKAMEAKKKTRFITIGTPSITFEKDKKSVATVLTPILARLFLPRASRETREIGKLIKSSPLDWTVVRFVKPVDEETTQNIVITYGEKKLDWKISRYNIAKFVFDQIKDDKYIRSMPIIGS